MVLFLGSIIHYLFFKNLLSALQSKGHLFFISAREKDVLWELMKEDMILINNKHVQLYNRGKGGLGWPGKTLYFIRTIFRLYVKAITFKPDLFISLSSPYASTCGFICRKPVITFEDTEQSILLHKLTRRFSSSIITGTSFQYNFGKKHLRLPYYKELTYLHPSVFKPDPSILKKYGLTQADRFVIIRLVSKHTIHEMGRTGLSDEFILSCIRKFNKTCRVLISSEHPLRSSLKNYTLCQSVIQPYISKASDIHHLLFYSTLLFGESATMAAETAVLGTPAIYIDNRHLGYCDELEKEYILVYNFDEGPVDKERAILKAIEIIGNPEIKKECRVNREKMLHDKLDMTGWMVEFVEKFERREEREERD